MSKPKQLNRGDNCPNCGGELHPAPVPSDKDFARFTDRENPGHLPYGSDTASPDQRAELGELFVCDRCGYKTRFAAESDSGGGGQAHASSDTRDGGDGGDSGNGGSGDGAAASTRSGGAARGQRR